MTKKKRKPRPEFITIGGIRIKTAKRGPLIGSKSARRCGPKPGVARGKLARSLQEAPRTPFEQYRWDCVLSDWFVRQRRAAGMPEPETDYFRPRYLFRDGTWFDFGIDGSAQWPLRIRLKTKPTKRYAKGYLRRKLTGKPL